MIDKHWLQLTPTHDYGVFIYPPVALSPSALFGLSEEACRRRARCDVYQVILPKLTSLLRALNFHRIKLITGQETEGPGGVNSRCGASEVPTSASVCSQGVSEMYVQKCSQ